MVRARPCLDWERLCVRRCLYACGGLRASADVPFISCAAFSPNSKRAVRSQVHELNTWTDRHGLPSHLARAAARFHCRLPRRRAGRSSVSALRSIQSSDGDALCDEAPRCCARFAYAFVPVPLQLFCGRIELEALYLPKRVLGTGVGSCCVVSSYN